MVEQLQQSTRSWEGERLPSYPVGQPEISILRIIIPPNTQLPLHQHRMISAGILLTGQLTVVLEDKRRLHLHAGDTLIEGVNKDAYLQK